MENSQKYYEIEILTRELKEGKEAAFDYLFRTRYKNLCRFAATFVVQFDVAEDIVQEVFEKIWKKSTQIDERESIDSYLFVAVRNACFTFLKNKREPPRFSSDRDRLQSYFCLRQLQIAPHRFAQLCASVPDR